MGINRVLYRRTAAGALVAAVLAGLAGCAGEEKTTAVVPEVVGLTLQEAQDTAQDAGFFSLSSADQSGQNRPQVNDRNWTVCSVIPAAGQEHPKKATVGFVVVKDDETCT